MSRLSSFLLVVNHSCAKQITLQLPKHSKKKKNPTFTVIWQIVFRKWPPTTLSKFTCTIILPEDDKTFFFWSLIVFFVFLSCFFFGELSFSLLWIAG